MAFSNVLVSCGFINAPQTTALFGAVQWSEAPASGTPTTNTAQPATSTAGVASTAYPVLRVSAAIDVYVSIGKAPDPVNGPRILVRAGENEHLFCASGDKLAWTAA